MKRKTSLLLLLLALTGTGCQTRIGSSAFEAGEADLDSMVVVSLPAPDEGVLPAVADTATQEPVAATSSVRPAAPAVAPSDRQPETVAPLPVVADAAPSLPAAPAEEAEAPLTVPETLENQMGGGVILMK